MAKKIEHINDFANRCGHFYNAVIEKNININNGYNCNHPEQEETETIDGMQVGKCYCWSCPLGYEPDEEDLEGEFIVVG